MKIAAAQIAATRNTKETAKKVLGIEGAAIGGIVGGFLGTFVGDPLGGAKKGGVIGGGLGEAAVGAVLAEQSLRATIMKGALKGHLPLVYAPFLRLNLGVSYTTKVVNVNATLQTQVALDVAPFLSFFGTEIELRFREGRLPRSEFKLMATAGIEFTLNAFGQLRLAATILSFLKNQGKEGKEEEPPGLLTLELLQTDVFPIAEALQGQLSASTELQLLKASKPVLTSKKVTGDGGGSAGQVLFNAMKGISKAAGRKKAAPGDGEEHSGTFEDPIPMDWLKPISIYLKTLSREKPDDVGRQTIRMFPHMAYPPDDFEAGVDGEFFPYKGKRMQKKGQEERRSVADRFRLELKKHDVNVESADIDHVQDIGFGGADDKRNLWPLESGQNRSAGPTQNQNQPVLVKGKGRVPISEVDENKWFIIKNNP